MTTSISNSTGSKRVDIITQNDSGVSTFIAFYVQVYKGEEQVLDSKDYKSLKMAQKWAAKQLNE